MIKKLIIFVLFTISSFSFFAKDEDKHSVDPEITEIIEVLGDVSLNRSVQSVSLVSKEHIRKFRFINMKSALSIIPGILTLSNGKFGQVSSTFIRGSKNTQVLYLIDGIKIRDGSNIGGLNLASISPYMVNKIEIIRGPLSSLYGSDAMGGVISIESSDEEGLNLNTSLGSHGSYQGHLSYGKKFEQFNFAVSAVSSHFSDNIDNDRFSNNGFTAKINFTGINHLKAGFRFFGNKIKSGIPFTLQMPTPERNYEQYNYIAAIPALIQLNSASRIKINLSYNRNNYIFKDRNDLWNPYFKNRSDNLEFEAVFNTRINNKIVFTAGLDNSNQNIFAENSFGITIDNMRTNYFSVFAQGDLELKGFFLTTSLRIDKYKDVETNFSPQIGLSYLINNRIKLRGSFSGSFKAPLLIHQINPWGTSNFDLNPEKGKSFEGGVDLYMKNLVFGITWFHTDYTDMIDWATINFVTWEGQYQNIAEAKISGLELNISYSPLKNFNLTASYTYLDTKDKNTGKELIRRPKNTIAASFVYNHRIFTISGKFVYVGKKYDIDFLSFPSEINTPQYNIFDINLIFPLRSEISLFGKITNLFDKDYQEIFGYPSPGRRFEIGISYRK
ncbi:MAG: TonB-dependent receptor [Acidobacteriota bacterium]